MQFPHMMESGLQSNEIRIPKTNAAKIAAFANVRNMTKNETGIGTAAAPTSLPDFDLGSPCQYFKSSFARSLSMHSNQTKSLDFGINFALARSSTIREFPSIQLHAPVHAASGYIDTETDLDFGDCPPPPLPARGPPSLPVGCVNTSSGNGQVIVSNGNGLASRNIRPNAANKQKNASKRRSFDSTEIEVLRLRKECQSLVEENRRLSGYTSSNASDSYLMNGNSRNIEAVLLQNQVDTLQWQLKQVEASREMYRAVMEEVVRFLERCHHSLDTMQNEQIARSKSIHYVCRNEMASASGHHSGCETTTATTDSPPPMIVNSRPLSAASSMDAGTKIIDETLVPSASSPANAAYNNFRDFTWRRSPRRNPASNGSDFNPEKLSQDAFRLFRTAQNLLNTQEPDLMMTKPSSLLGTNPPTPLPGLPPQTNLNSLSSSTSTRQSNNNCHVDSESFCITFSRKLNMRESHSSLRSSTDGSVHSTTSTSSSSKTETDEELCHHHHHDHHQVPASIKEAAACSTEDESGFSSISSFQEIGLPLHSTLISTNSGHHHNGSSSHSDDSSESAGDIGSIESRNSTLKATQTQAVGLPPPQSNHRRWDSAPAIPPRPAGLHLFSGEESSSTVLWV